jgi:hypothetical protein
MSYYHCQLVEFVFSVVTVIHFGIWEAALIRVHVAPCPGSLGIESRSASRCAFRTAFADVLSSCATCMSFCVLASLGSDMPM